MSDVDLLIVVDGDRTVARRCVADVASDLREQQFDGHRYEFEHYVESAESARRASDRLREIFEEGIAIYQSERFRELYREVITDE